MVADSETDLILGMHAIGPHVTDLIAEGVFAKLVEGTPEEIGMSIHAHPSLAEVVGEASMAVDGHAIHLCEPTGDQTSKEGELVDEESREGG